MKIQWIWAPRALPLLIALFAGLAWWGASAPARAGEAYTYIVGLSGTVSEATENVAFSGSARVSSRLAPDPDFNRPTLVLFIDLTQVSGVGTKSRKKFVLPTPALVQRRLAPSHVVEITFPYVENGKGALAAKSAVASFSLTFDTATGAITEATGAVRTAKF